VFHPPQVLILLCLQYSFIAYYTAVTSRFNLSKGIGIQGGDYATFVVGLSVSETQLNWTHCLHALRFNLTGGLSLAPFTQFSRRLAL